MDFNNISILNIMPPNLAKDQNVKDIADAFDQILRDIIKKIPNVSIIPDLVLNRIVNETLIDLLAWQFHVDFYDPDMPLNVKRSLVLKSLDWHARKGTISTIEEIVTQVFATAKIEEWFEYGGPPYHFRIAVGDYIPDKETRNKIIHMVNISKNTRSFLEILTSKIIFQDELGNAEKQSIHGKLKIPYDAIGDSFLVYRNGKYRRNGKTWRQVNTVYVDEFVYKIINNSIDKSLGLRLHNGLFKRNGTVKRGFINDLCTEYSSVKAKMETAESVQAAEAVSITVKNERKEWLEGEFRRNGVYRRNGIKRHQNNVIQENITARLKTNIQEQMYGLAFRNSMYRRNGTLKHKFTNYPMTDCAKEKIKLNLSENFGECRELFVVGYRKYTLHNGKFARNGQVKRVASALMPLEG